MAKKIGLSETDFLLYGGGTVYLLTPVSQRGEEWATEHLPADAQRLGSGVAVEHRYIQDIADGFQCDGLNIVRA
jgi:hypothetical protein